MEFVWNIKNLKNSVGLDKENEEVLAPFHLLGHRSDIRRLDVSFHDYRASKSIDQRFHEHNVARSTDFEVLKLSQRVGRVKRCDSLSDRKARLDFHEHLTYRENMYQEGQREMTSEVNLIYA